MSANRRTLRLFVAAYPPREVVDSLLAHLPALGLPAHRSTPVEQVYLTLQFIGDTDQAGLAPVAESVRRAASGIGAFVLSPRRLVTLPERGPVRLIAAETDAPAPLLELHRRLVHRLARRPRGRGEERFRPHLTLARFGSPAAGVRVAREVACAPFTVGEVLLMSSVLRPGGAEHATVERVALGSTVAAPG